MQYAKGMLTGQFLKALSSKLSGEYSQENKLKNNPGCFGLALVVFLLSIFLLFYFAEIRFKTATYKKTVFLGQLFGTLAPTKDLKGIDYNDLIIEYVVWGGIEPPTQGFSVLCSTN